MMRPNRLCCHFRGLAILVGTLVCQAQAGAGKLEKSDAKVKATATATKPGADGKQYVTITLEVEKGWYIYANPVNANSEVLDGNETIVSFKGKAKVKASVVYPAGKLKTLDKYKYHVYEDKVTIQAEVQREPGDEGPLQISINVNACRKNECLFPGTVKLTVP